MVALCPICTGEYALGELLCPNCGCGLVAGSLSNMYKVEDQPRQDPQEEFTELCRPRLYPVAMLIKQTLEQNGVAAIVKGGYSLSVLPHLAFSGELRVVVPSRDIEYARELYHAYFESVYLDDSWIEAGTEVDNLSDD
jgi:hypothetical protein